MNQISLMRKAALPFAFAGALALSGVAAAQTFTFSQSRPRLVVLIHGVTQKPTEDPAIGVGTTKHARYYWGFDFIKGVQGRPDETTMRVITPRTDGTFTFKTNQKLDWGEAVFTPTAGELAPICYPTSWFTNLPPNIETDQRSIREYISLMTRNGTAATMVMVSARDGSKHLMPQLAEFIDETFLSYQTTFGSLPAAQQPQIYLVGHSFGGIIARTLMANPTGTDLFGGRLTPTQRTRADFLRSRVVLINTLSAPHHGTHIPRVAGDVANFIDLEGMAVIAGYYALTAALPWKNYSKAWVQGQTRRKVEAVLDAVSGRRDSLQDITRMAEYNAGIINPNTLRRPNGELVPIYTASGRNPGGYVYNRSRSVFFLGGVEWNPISNLDIAMDGNRRAREAMALHIIEGLMHREGYGREPRRPWGTATLAAGDRVRSPYAGEGRSTTRQNGERLHLDLEDIRYIASKFFAGQPYTFGASDGEWDNDGFLGFDSGHALGLSGINWFRVFEPTRYGGMMPWDNDNHGSMMFNAGSGLWIHNELVRDAGPYVFRSGLRRSVWTPTETPATPNRGIRIEFSELADVARNLDYLSGADFTMTVRAGSTQQTVNLADNNDVMRSIPSFTLNNYASTVIPVRIEVTERDTPDPHDLCVLSPVNSQDALYFYVDLRTGRIMGDINGQVGQTITARPWWSVANRVQLKFRVVPL